MTITASPPLASHLLELVVDITLGCNYIINWRYRERPVSSPASVRSGNIQIGTLFTAWLRELGG